MPALIDNAITPDQRNLLLTSDCPDFSAQAHEFTGDERATVSLLARNDATRSTTAAHSLETGPW
jgi:hypothetical protein